MSFTTEFNESFMGMNKSAKSPGTSRKGRVRRKDSGERLTTKVRPGVDPGVLKMVRKDYFNFEVRLRDGDKLVARVTRSRSTRLYGYTMVGDRKMHTNFTSLEEVKAKVATKL